MFFCFTRTIKIYNSQQIGVEEKFVPHFATWLSQKRWEIEHVKEIPDLIDSLESEKYSSFSNIKHFATIFIPDNTGLVYNGAYSDATGREIFQSFVISDWENINYSRGINISQSHSSNCRIIIFPTHC